MNEAERWQLAIGRVIFSFGFIELYLNQILSAWLDSCVYEHVRSSKLIDRLRLITSMAPEHSRDAVFSQSVIDAMSEVKRLSEMRNTVAHKPVLVGVRREASGKLNVNSRIGHPRKQGVYKLADVQRIGEEAEALSTTLHRQVCDIIEDVLSGRLQNATRRNAMLEGLNGGEVIGIAAE